MINTPYKDLKPGQSDMSAGIQFLIFIAIFIGTLLAGYLLGVKMIAAVYGSATVNAIETSNITAPNFAAALWMLQITSTTLPIFIAPVFFASVIMRDTLGYIKPTLRFPWILMLLVLLVMLASYPTMELLSNINQKMTLPSWLKWMREMEDSAEKITGVMLQMKNVWQMLFNVAFIGLVTAIVEEFMFRGVIQTIFVKWTKNVHVAIWVTAILFSAFHMEFFGFLPRLLLGALFGYFVAWSGSIWTSVWAHFINNGAAVVVTYLYQNKETKLNPDDQHVFNNVAYIFSAVIILLLLFVYRWVSSPKIETPDY